MFKAYDPHYEQFVAEVEKCGITSETTLVGHSLGGGFWVKYLSENPDITVDKVVLVAPGIDSDNSYGIDFFTDLIIDPAVAERANQFVIFSSDNDSQEIQASTTIIAEKLPNATRRIFHNYGHFTMGSMKTDAFPELLEVIL